ncbi:MAG: ABC transporter permease [Bacteroidales bacterium]|nr:ABC transporter permease [Bacteroidales bacterium]
MIHNIIKIAFRNFLKHKVYFLINILGLSAGFTAFIIISLFINYEYNWDKQNENYDRIYRIQRRFVKSGNDISPHNYAILAKLIEDKYPEIEEVLLFYDDDIGEFLTTSKIKDIFVKKGIYSDQAIFNIFSYQFINGDKENALTEPNSIVISKTLADKLFEEENALGQTIILEKKFNLKVTGVYKDLPENSSIRPNYIISLSSIEKTKNRPNFRYNWWGDYRVYVMLKNGQDYKLLDKKIENLFEDYPNVEFEHLYLLPLSRHYLTPDDRNDYLIAIFLYGLIGVFILLLSSINYINLSTANASVRAKEVAVKKSHGSNKLLLIIQFLCESVLISFFAVCLALFFTESLLPVFNNVIQKHLELSYIENYNFVLEIILIALGIGVLSGIYPAFFMSSQKAIVLFKGNFFIRKKNRFSAKKLLVVFQFSISIFLIILTLTFSMQIRHMMNMDLGFDKENILYTKFRSTREDGNFENLKARILRHPEIISASCSEHIPFVSSGGGNINWEGGLVNETISIRDNLVSYDFFKTYKMSIIMGRDFSNEFSADKKKNCIINETAWKKFGWENPIGKRINNNTWNIIGVVQDFHFRNLHEKIEPYIALLQSESVFGEWTFSFRVNPEKLEEAEKILNEEFEAYFPNDPFQFHLLSEDFKYDDTLLKYEMVNNTIMFFTVINILLAIIGLLGLVSFTTERRTKEIGIRKINGSSAWNIFLILTKEYLGLVVIATLIVWPCAYYLYQFMPGANRYGLKLWEYITSSGIVLIIILITSGYQTLKAARRNPVEALRYE